MCRGFPLLLLGSSGVGKRTLCAELLNGGGAERRTADGASVVWNPESLMRAITEGSEPVVADLSCLPAEAQRELAVRLSGNRLHNPPLILLCDGEPAELRDGQRLEERLAWELMGASVVFRPLRDRPEDIAPIGTAVLQHFAASLQLEPPEFDSGFWAVLETHDFPANGHELRAMMLTLLLQRPADRLTHAHATTMLTENLMPRYVQNDHDGHEPRDSTTVRWPALLPTLQQVRSLLIAEAIRRAGGNQSEAARMLGITPSAISKYNASLGRRSDRGN